MYGNVLFLALESLFAECPAVEPHIVEVCPRIIDDGISGKKGNTGKLSMVKLLVDYSITGACHAPVNIRQGKVCKVQTRGYRLPDYL